jgi:hypothetical protein
MCYEFRKQEGRALTEQPTTQNVHRCPEVQPQTFLFYILNDVFTSITLPHKSLCWHS